MEIQPLSIDGAHVLTPRQHRDDRGTFLEWYRVDHFSAAVGRPMRMAQGNISVSARGVIRGIHVTDVPPGQAKYVTCARGVLLDVIVDLRVGSPTFGRYETVRLDDVDRRTAYLAERAGTRLLRPHRRRRRPLRHLGDVPPGARSRDPAARP